MRVFGQWQVGRGDRRATGSSSRTCNELNLNMNCVKGGIAGTTLVVTGEHLVTPGADVVGCSSRSRSRWSCQASTSGTSGCSASTPAPTRAPDAGDGASDRAGPPRGRGRHRHHPSGPAPDERAQLEIQHALVAACREATARRDVSAVIVYGGEKVFAAGADIKEMETMSYTDMVDRSALLQDLHPHLARLPKPTVAAITGYALGGGCELALSLRLPGRGARRRARPAGDPARHHPRRRGHAAAFPAGRSGPGQGHRLLRPLRRGRGSAARSVSWTRSSRPPRRSTPRHVVAWSATSAGPAYASGRPRRPSTVASRLISRPASRSSGCSSPVCSRHEDRAIGMASFVEHGPGKATVRGRLRARPLRRDGPAGCRASRSTGAEHVLPAGDRRHARARPARAYAPNEGRGRASDEHRRLCQVRARTPSPTAPSTSRTTPPTATGVDGLLSELDEYAVEAALKLAEARRARRARSPC